MKILLATDGSEHSRLALEQAAALAAPSKGEVVALVVSNLINLGWYGAIPHATETPFEVPTSEEAEQILAGACKTLSARGVACRPLRRVGVPADTILAVAEEERVDLIVMGSHGRTGLGRFLLGSVSSQVSTHAPCSVLIAKPKLDVVSPDFPEPIHLSNVQKA
ncbi:putative universal stress protein [compost metagenome]